MTNARLLRRAVCQTPHPTNISEIKQECFADESVVLETVGSHAEHVYQSTHTKPDNNVPIPGNVNVVNPVPRAALEPCPEERVETNMLPPVDTLQIISGVKNLAFFLHDNSRWERTGVVMYSLGRLEKVGGGMITVYWFQC